MKVLVAILGIVTVVAALVFMCAAWRRDVQIRKWNGPMEDCK